MKVQLPIDSRLAELVGSLHSHPSLVIVAAPGAGKTTRFPPALLRDLMAHDGKSEIWVLEPRRLAAKAAATRIAFENGWKLGEEVGYQVRFEKSVSKKTRLRVVTEGILNRRLQSDPLLEGIGAVVLDEFHERSWHTDLALALLRELQREVRPDLRIIVMSATLEAEPVSKFLQNCPIANVPGLLHPVEIRHSRDPLLLQPTGSFSGAKRPGSEISERISLLVESILMMPEPSAQGNILIFLPGAREITGQIDALYEIAKRSDCELIPLHGSLTLEEQNRAILPSGRRKIICATNIAETSLTLDGVSVVIDSGLARVMKQNQLGLPQLSLSKISLSSARQRTGRAGRQMPGLCFRLWTKNDELSFPEFDIPELHRMDLSEPILLLASMGVRQPENWTWFDSPPIQALAQAKSVLLQIGAIKENGELTSLGAQIRHLPLHPRLACLLLASHQMNKLELGTEMVALLSERDILQNSRGLQNSTSEESDVVLRWHHFKDGRNHPSVHSFAKANVQRVQKQLLRDAENDMHHWPTPKRENEDLAIEEIIEKLVFMAYPDRLARRRRTGEPRALSLDGQGLVLAENSCVRKSELFVCLDAMPPSPFESGTAREPKISMASRVDAKWVTEHFQNQPGQKLEKRVEPFYDEASGKILVREMTAVGAIALDEPRIRKATPDESAVLLQNQIFEKWPQLLAAHPRALKWWDRIAFAKIHFANLGWPEPNEMILRSVIENLCMGETAYSDIVRKDPLTYFEMLLTPEMKKLLQNEAPETVLVPSGSQIAVEYPEGQNPFLQVRLQEIFGWQQAPRLAGGKVNLVLHLLAPNYRPTQVTSDLASFWKTAYFEVRRELKARYPKHSWPEDPLTAPAKRKGPATRR
jgi:ATP-dependent helicase HrpB